MIGGETLMTVNGAKPPRTVRSTRELNC